MKIKRMINRATDNKAFSMVELLMGMMVVSIIGAVIAGSFISGNQIKNKQDAVVEMQQISRLSLYLMGRELKSAGTALAANWSAANVQELTPQDIIRLNTITDPLGNQTSVSFRYVVDALEDVDWDGDEDQNDEVIVQYSLNPAGTGDLERTVTIVNNGGGLGDTAATTSRVATNFSALIFSFYNDNGTGTRAWSTTPGVSPSYTVAVGITMVTQSDVEDEDLTAVARQFTDPYTNTTYTSPADRFRRRVVATVVNLRNIQYASN